MKQRSRLYDTRTYTLENKDLSQGIFFTVISIGLVAYTQNSTDPYLIALSSLVAYLGVLFSSERSRLLIPVALSLSMLLPRFLSQELFRLVIFSTAISLIPRRRESAIPLVLLVVLWTLFLNSTHLGEVLGKNTFQVKPIHLRVALLEIAGFIFLMVLLWSKPFSAFFGRLPGEVDISTISFILFFLSTFVGAALAGTAFLNLAGLSLDAILPTSRKTATCLTLISTTLMAVPLVLSSALNKLFSDLSRRLELIFHPEYQAAQLTTMSPKIRQFVEILSLARALQDESDQRLRDVEINTRNAQALLEERQKELLSKMQDADNVASVMSLSPIGYIAMTGSGAVLSSNKTLDAQFALEHSDEQLGAHFTELKVIEDAKESVTQRSVVLFNFLARIIAEQKDLARGQSLQSFATLDAHTFVQFTVYLFDERVIPVDWKRMSQQLAPSSLTIVVFSSVRDDMRRFVLDQLQPNPLEILGGQSIDLCREINSGIDAFAERYILEDASLEALRVASPEQLEAQLRVLLNGASDFRSELKTLILDHLRHSQPILQPSTPEERDRSKELLSPIDLVKEFEQLLRMFDILTGQSVETEFSVPSAIDLDGNTIKRPIVINSIKSQLFGFFATFLSVLTGIAKRAEGAPLTVSIGTEQLGVSTAALFKGSHPGNYARIMISHDGQSVTANMLPESIRGITAQYSAGEELDATLAIMALEVDRLNGFFSIQSSPVKGTHLTIYLPNDPLAVDKSFRLTSRKARPHKVALSPQPKSSQESLQMPAPKSIPAGNEHIEEEQSATRILLVEDDASVSSEIQSLISRQGVNSIEAVSREEIRAILKPVDFSGSGFSSGDSAEKLFSSGVDLDSFTLIVVSILGELAEGMRLLKELGNKRPILIVTKDPDSADALSALHPVVTYPIDEAQLSSILSNIR